MAMNVDDFKKLVETLDLPEDVKNKVFEATKDENVVPYEWEDDTHLGAEIEDSSGNKFILYSEDDSMDFFGIPVDENGRPKRRDAAYVGRRSKIKFTGRKAIMVDTNVPNSADDVEVGEVFAAKMAGEDVVVQRRLGNAYKWAVLYRDGDSALKADSEVQLIHRLVEAK